LFSDDILNPVRPTPTQPYTVDQINTYFDTGVVNDGSRVAPMGNANVTYAAIKIGTLRSHEVKTIQVKVKNTSNVW
jgi:hypothetical protein